MKEYEFSVSICGGYPNGTIKVNADNEERAYEKAYEYMGTKLYEAFPELEIEYDVECVCGDDDKEE